MAFCFDWAKGRNPEGQRGHHRSWALAGLLLALGGAAVRAQTQTQPPAPNSPEAIGRLPLTLAAARRLALERNDDLRVARIQVEAAMGNLRAAREFPNPLLGLSTAKINSDGQTNGTPGGNGLLERSYDSIVSLNQLLLIGKRGLLRDAAAAGVRAAEYHRDDARRLLIEAVTQAYAAALAARGQAEVLMASAVALRREAVIAEHRRQAGDLSDADEARIEIAAGQDELGAASQRASARVAVVTLEILLGEQNPDGSTPLADRLETLAALDAAEPGSIPAGGSSASAPSPAERPDIVAAEAAAQQAEAAFALQKRQRIPDVTLSVQYEREPPDQPNTVGVGLSLPLPLWNRYSGEILSARAARDQSQAELDRTRIQAGADIASARVAYREAAARAREYRDSLEPKSERATRSVTYAYEKGGATLVDLLEAQRSDNALRLAAVQARADTVAAAAALLAALGQLEP